MIIDERPPGGPRGAVGAAAERAAARHLIALGWSIVARNVRIGRDEVDIVAIEPGERPTLVVVEVRSHSGAGFGSPIESVNAAKVSRLYRAVLTLRRSGYAGSVAGSSTSPAWRVDLLSLRGLGGSGWAVESHIRGLAPP